MTLLFSDRAPVGELMIVLSRPDREAPISTRQVLAYATKHETETRCLYRTAYIANTQHLCRRLPLVVLLNLLRLSSDLWRHNNSPVIFLPNLSLPTPLRACGGFGPWRAGVWSGACVSGTLRCVGGGGFRARDGEDGE